MLHKLLRESAARRGWVSQRKVEDALGFPQGRIHRWLKGTGEPGWTDVVRWAQALGVPLDYLADDAVDEIPEPSAPDVTAEERQLLEVLRRSGITPVDALARLLTPPRLGSVRDETAVEERQRLLETKRNDKGADRKDSPSRVH